MKNRKLFLMIGFCFSGFVAASDSEQIIPVNLQKLSNNEVRIQTLPEDRWEAFTTEQAKAVIGNQTHAANKGFVCNLGGSLAQCCGRISLQDIQKINQAGLIDTKFLPWNLFLDENYKSKKSEAELFSFTDGGITYKFILDRTGEKKLDVGKDTKDEKSSFIGKVKIPLFVCVSGLFAFLLYKYFLKNSF
jgi:hypothetical protein